MQYLNTELTQAPYVMQVTNRLADLNLKYSKPAVEAAFLVILTGLSSKQSILGLHVTNILLTYDNDTLKDAMQIMNYSIFLQKAV